MIFRLVLLIKNLTILDTKHNKRPTIYVINLIEFVMIRMTKVLIDMMGLNLIKLTFRSFLFYTLLKINDNYYLYYYCII